MKGLLNRLIERGSDSQSNVDFVHPRTPSRFESRVSVPSSDLDISEEHFGSDGSIVTSESATLHSSDEQNLKPAKSSTTDSIKHSSIKSSSAKPVDPAMPAQLNHTEAVSSGKPQQANEDSGYQVRASASPEADTDINVAVSDWQGEMSRNHQETRVDQSIRVVQQSEEIVTEAENTSGNNPAAVVSSDVEQGMTDIINTAVDREIADLAVTQPAEVRKSSPQISVRIGRIEVRATSAPASTSRSVATTNAGRQSSLTSYLGWKRR